MVIQTIFSLKYFFAAISLVTLFHFQVARADGFDSVSGLMAPGSTAVISIDPVLPIPGEPVTINVTGVWKNRCIPDQDSLTYTTSESSFWEDPEIVQFRYFISATLDTSINCVPGGGLTPWNIPTPYKLSLTVPGSDRDELLVGVAITGPLPGNKHGHMSWSRVFDLVLGLHEIHPRLHSGYWLSEKTPYQALLIEQQGSTVVFHELTYDRTTGSPKWLYADGKFQGNTLNGVAYRIHWLSPVPGARTSVTRGPRGTLEFERRLVQPEKQDLKFNATSAEIRVGGVNSIGAYLGLHDLDDEPRHRIFHGYRPWVFDLDDVKLPSIVPKMTGPWTLYGFDGQHLEQSHQIEFHTGTRVGKDLYRFSSSNGKWVLDCPITIQGEGACTLENKSVGLTMHYNLYNVHAVNHYHWGPQFNGNFAKAPLVNSNGDTADQTGVLLRSGLRLPVFDVQ